MFDIGWGELLLIGIVALIVIGPKELPGALRSLGQWVTKIRRMAGEFQNQFQEAMREAELADLKKEVDDMTTHASQMAHFDPLEGVRKDVEAAQREIESAVNVPPLDEPPANEAPVTPTSSYGEATPPAGSESHPVTAEATAPSAEPAPLSAASNVAAASAEPAPAVSAAESASPAPQASPTDAGTGTAKPDAGRAPA